MSALTTTITYSMAKSVSHLPPWLDGTTNQWRVHGKSSASPGSLVHRPRTGGQDNTYIKRKISGLATRDYVEEVWPHLEK